MSRGANIIGFFRRLFRPLCTVDLRSLAAFRMALGLLVLLDVVLRSFDLRAFYTDYGALPRVELLEKFRDDYQFSLLVSSGAAWFQAALFLLTAAAALSLALGYRTRVAAIVCWVLFVSIQRRNPLVLQGGDVLFRIMVLFAVFLPLAERWSVDALMRTKKDEQSRPTAYCSILAFAYILQLMSMYILTGIIKWREPSWKEGLGLHYALDLQMFTTWLGAFVSSLPHAVLRFGNFATLWVEAFLPLVLLIPWRTELWRTLCIVTMAAFHVFILLTLKVGLFSLISVVAWIPLLPPGFWRYVAARWGGLPAAAESKPGESCSDRPGEVQGSRLDAVVGAVFCVLLLGWNLPTVHPKLSSSLVQAAIRPPVMLLALDQRWAMFSKPVLRDGWIIIPAVQSDGGMLDLFTGEPYRGAERPSSLSSRFEKDRWRKYWQNLLGPHKAQLLGMGRYLCRRSARQSDASKRIEAFEVILLREQLQPRGERTAPKRELLWRHECQKGMIEKWRAKLPFDNLPVPK